MNLYQFVQHADSNTTKRVFAITGRHGYLREDALQLLLKRAIIVLGSCRPIYYRLREIQDAPSRIVCASSYNVRVIRWEPHLLNEGEVRDFLRLLKQRVPAFTILLDSSDELLPAFKKIYQKGLKPEVGLWVECDKGVWDKVRLVKSRLWGGAKGTFLPEAVLTLIKDRLSLNETYNLIHVIEYLRDSVTSTPWRSPTRRHLEALGLLRGGLEKTWAIVLVHENKWVLLNKHYKENQEVDRTSFFYAVFAELIRILKLKTMRGKSMRERMDELNLFDIEEFKEYEDSARRQRFADLFRRLKLTIQIMRWRPWSGSIPLLLLYW